MPEMIFQASDLQTKRTEFLAAAREGRAVLRDKDGTGYVMVPESQLNYLELMAKWSQALGRLEVLARREWPAAINDLGDLAWLRVFDLDDLQEFIGELKDVLTSTYADQDAAILQQCLRDWRITARQLEDPLRRSVLLSSNSVEDFVEAPRPADVAE